MGRILLRRPRLSTRKPLVVCFMEQYVETEVKEKHISKQHLPHTSDSEADDKLQSQRLSKQHLQRSSDSDADDKSQSQRLRKQHRQRSSDSDADDKSHSQRLSKQRWHRSSHSAANDKSHSQRLNKQRLQRSSDSEADDKSQSQRLSKQRWHRSSHINADNKSQSQRLSKQRLQRSSDSDADNKSHSQRLRNQRLQRSSDSDADDKSHSQRLRNQRLQRSSDSEADDKSQSQLLNKQRLHRQYVPITETKLELNEVFNSNNKKSWSLSDPDTCKQVPSQYSVTSKSMLAKLHEEESKIPEVIVPGIKALILQTSRMSQVPVEKAESIVYSRNTYTKITQLLAEKYMTNSVYNDKVNVVRIPTEDLGEFRRRIPQRQLIIEIAAVLKEHIKETMNINVQTVIQSVPKYQFGSKGKSSTEIVLYRQSENEEKKCEKTTTDGYISTGEIKYFQGSVRTPTPFTGPYENMVFPEDLSLLDCMLCGGKFLNLKAQFIYTLPDISYLKDTLTSINLSFNHFTTLPITLLGMKNLEILKLRDNPLCVIPAGICKLKRSLHTLILSFCLLSDLPPEFSLLTELRHLDLSYNLLSSLPDAFSNLCFLEELSVEGNKISMLPSGLLQLDLQSFNTSNNFLQPLFWPETLKAFNEDSNDSFPDSQSIGPNTVHKDTYDDDDDTAKHQREMKHQLDDVLAICHHCDKKFKRSAGLPAVRICKRVFGIPAVLVLFVTCSEKCKNDI